MKTIKTLLSVCCLLGLALLLPRCLKDSITDDTIILIGEEKYVKPIESMIPDTLKNLFLEQLGNVHEGLVPPNLEGEYCIGEIAYCESNYLDLMNNDNMYLRVTRQHNRVAAVEFFDNKTVSVDTAYIMGSEDKFTLYMTENRRLPSPLEAYSFTRTVVISGKKTDEGIRDTRLGFIYMEVSGPELIDFWKPGTYYIYKDKDGLSENCAWFAFQGGGKRQ